MTSNQYFGFRIDGHDKQLIKRAATLLGLNTSQFAVSTLAERAREVIDQRTNKKLSNRNREIFLAALDTDAQPNAALREAARRYKNCQK